MRKIEKAMILAIKNGLRMNDGNTSVCHVGGVAIVRLHGHKIAEVGHRAVKVDSCGWSTNTTKSRLNAILGDFCGTGITQKSYRWSIGNEPFIDGMEVLRS